MDNNEISFFIPFINHRQYLHFFFQQAFVRKLMSIFPRMSNYSFKVDISIYFSLSVSQFPRYLLPYGVSEGRLGLSWLGKPKGKNELSCTQDTYLLSHNTDCLPSPSVGLQPISTLCSQIAAYLSLQPHTSHPQLFWVPLHTPQSKNTHMH